MKNFLYNELKTSLCSRHRKSNRRFYSFLFCWFNFALHVSLLAITACWDSTRSTSKWTKLVEVGTQCTFFFSCCIRRAYHSWITERRLCNVHRSNLFEFIFAYYFQIQTFLIANGLDLCVRVWCVWESQTTLQSLLHLAFFEYNFVSSFRFVDFSMIIIGHFFPLWFHGMSVLARWTKCVYVIYYFQYFS